MAKLTLNDLSSLTNQTSAIALINANNTLCETALENTLSLDGTSPNSMSADLDMDSNHILNLPEPASDLEPVRLIDLTSALGGEDTFSLDSLNDVVITSAADNDFLRFDGANWVDEAVSIAPATVDYIVKTASSDLSAERVATDNTSITWDFGTSAQAKLSRAALTGDVTASANSNATTIANDAVTYAKMQNVSAASKLLGRGDSSSGDTEEITLGTGLSMSSTTLNASLSSLGGAPSTSDYLVKTTDASLSAERVVTDGTSITADWSSAGAVTFKRAALTGAVTASADSNTTTIAVLPVTFVIACSDETTALTATNAKITFRMPHAMTVTGVRASLTTAQASGNIFTVDINEAGTTILSTKLTVDNTELTSTTAATPAVISDATLADDASITVDIDQIGDGTAKGLKVVLIGTKP